MPCLEGQRNIGEVVSQRQEVQAHSWQSRFRKAVDIALSLREQLPGKVQAGCEFPAQLLQAQGTRWEPPGTSLYQKQW